MASRTFAYLSSTSPVYNSTSGGVTIAEQKTALEKKVKTGFNYMFSEDFSTSNCRITVTSTGSAVPIQERKEIKILPPKREAFTLLLKNLEKGDLVVIWSWTNLADWDRKSWASFDVLARVALIHKVGASVMFVLEGIETRTPSGRLALQTLSAAEQYSFDLATEIVDSQKQQVNAKPVCPTQTGC